MKTPVANILADVRKWASEPRSTSNHPPAPLPIVGRFYRVTMSGTPQFTRRVRVEYVLEGHMVRCTSCTDGGTLKFMLLASGPVYVKRHKADPFPQHPCKFNASF